MKIENYIQSNVYGLPGVSQKRDFDENGNSIDPDFTYGDIKASLTQRNINKDLNIHKDRVKKIHREAMNIRDNSSTRGQIWTRMDQDDPRMSRYNFPDKPDYPVGDESGKLQYGRDITDAINTSDNSDVKALREFLTKNTIAPSYNTWIKYGTEKPPYGFRLNQTAIENKIINIIQNHDTVNEFITIDSGSDEYNYNRTIDATSFILHKGLAADKLNIYSYIQVTTDRNTSVVSKTYYYIPAQPLKFTDIVQETSNEGEYYRRYYERYHIVNSKVNSLRDDNSLRYSYKTDNSDFDLDNLGNEFIFNINTDSSPTTDIDSTILLNGDLEYGDYFREYSKTKWKVFGDNTVDPPTGRRFDIGPSTVTSADVTSTETDFTFDKDLSDNQSLNNIYLTKDDYFIYNDGTTDYYIVSAEPGRTVWMITKSATIENNDKATLQTEVRDVRNEAMNVRDSLSTKPSQLWLKMNRNDPRNSEYLYPELTPVHWSSNGNIKPEMGRDLENVLDSSNFSSLKNYVVDDTSNYSIDNYYTCNLSLEPIYFYDYLNSDSSNYYTIDYDKSRKEMGMGISSVVSNFLIGTPSSTSNNYILNSKIDTKTQNVLMDSLLEKQYGDLYVMNVASVTSNDVRIKPGDYYIKPEEKNYVFGQVWVKTNLNKKLDFGRELYDSELTKILKDGVTSTPGTVSTTYTLQDGDFTTKFTKSDLANLGIKSLDYIYVTTDSSNIDYYFKAMPNTNGIYDGRNWEEVVIGATPNESFGRQLYHQNLSEKLNSTSDSNGKVTLTIDEYSNLNLDKLNLEPSNYILDRDNDKSYRPKPIDIWLSVRSTENQHVYNKHRQESVSDNKYIAQDVRQNSDVPGQIWKKMTADEAKNLKFDYGAITPLAWETTSNGEIEPKKGRNLKEYLSGNTAVLNELREYINNQVFILDTFNTHTNLRDFSDNGGFNHDDYVLLDTDGSAGLNKPHKYYTIDYDVSRDLNTTRDLSKDEFTISDTVSALKQDFNNNLLAYTPDSVIDFSTVIQSFNDIKDHIIQSSDNSPITFAGNEDNIYYSLGNYYYYPNNADGSSWTVTTSQPIRAQVTISVDVSDAVKQAFNNNLTAKTSSRVTNFSSLSQSFTDIIPNTLDSSGSGPIDFNTDYNVVYYANENDYYYPNNAGGSEWTVTTTSPEGTKRLNIHTSKTSDQLIKFLTENNFENYSENYNYPYKKYYVDILNSTRDSKTNIITKYGDEYILLDHRDVPNREDDASNIATLVPNNIKYGDYYKDGNDAWVAIRSHKKQKEYDDNTNYNEVRTLAKRKRSESTTVGNIWIKMKKTDPRFSKYNYENLNASPSSRKITLTTDSNFVNFLEKNINLYNGSEQMSFVLDSKVDFRTNRITEYGNEYVTFEDSYNQEGSPEYGKYHEKETTNYGDTWYSIGTKKPNKGRLIISSIITGLIESASWSSINEKFINVYASETEMDGNNSDDITILQFLKDFNLTDDDYIECTISSMTQYFRPKPHDVWVVTRSLDEQAKYDEKIRIKYRDIYQEAKVIRQSSKTIGQIWIQVDSLDDPLISLDKYPHRRQLSADTITGQLQILLQNYTTNPYTADGGDSSINEFQRKIYNSDENVDYVQNRFYVVDSDIDMATYQIKYEDSENPESVRSGLGKELVILDKNKIPDINQVDQDSVIIDGKDMGEILRYGDYYTHGGKYYVVSRSYNEEHAKDLADQALKDIERANQDILDSNTLLNTYQFSDTDDRYGRLWQKVTTLDNYINSSNRKILKHTFTENIIENDGYTLKLTNTELDNLLNDFTMTKVLSTKYIKHPTKNQYYVTSNYGTTWVKHESLPEVGTEIFIKKDDPNGGTDLYFTNDIDKVILTTSNNFGYIGNSNNTVELSSDEEVLKLLLFNGLIDKHYVKLSDENYYETNNSYNSTSNEITWDKVDFIPLDKKYLSESSILDSLLSGTSFTINATEYEDLLSSNDYNLWAEHNSRKRHFVTQYININSSNYYISNDEGYNWKKIDDLNRVHNNTDYSYKITHDNTETILDNGRTLLTTDELDDLLNNAKYSSNHGSGSSLTDDLNNQYVSHRLLTNQHYLTDNNNGSNYIPQRLVNEDYKNYINMPGKGKLGQYWKLRYFEDDSSTPNLSPIVINSSNDYIRNILEGNDNDTNRYQYNKERLTLTADERNIIAGGNSSNITLDKYIPHSVKSDYYYMSNDNGYNWFKVHKVSDSSVRLVQLEENRIYDDINQDLGQIIYDKYTHSDTDTNEFSIKDEQFYNYEVEKYVRENGYIQYTDIRSGGGTTIYTFVPGEYINENYNYFPADNEYPAKNTLGRIWNTLTSSPSGGSPLSPTNNDKFNKLKELLYSKNILNIDLSSTTFRIDLSNNLNIYYQATDNKFYYPTDADNWTVTTTRPDDKLEIRLDFTVDDSSGNDVFNNALTTTAPSSNTVTLSSSEYNNIEIDLESNKNVYYTVTDSSDTYYYIPTDSTKLRWYSQKDVPGGSLKIIESGSSAAPTFTSRTTTNTNIKGTTNATVTLSYEEYALNVESLDIDITKENYIQIGNKYYVPGRLINEYSDNFYLPT